MFWLPRRKQADDATEKVHVRIDKMMSEILDSIPSPWRFEDFCEYVADRRGKPIELRPIDAVLLDGAPCGWSVDYEASDIIYYAVNTAADHSRFISYHECAHLLFGHTGTERARQAIVDLAPELDRDKVRNALGRTDFKDPQETEAEILALRLHRYDMDMFDLRATDPAAAARVVRFRKLLGGLQ
ncbi:hypothetical protein [Prescottella agglutinans]|uniref:IrrE N-terminal-like domain-containing protein n=1 Tax=Prescottella agglutinans TaxID=1644129 RepID=A0ABT6MJ82_9NOCA|nr:hypothetical protein [Prescottella agglutinans]MDH6283955.1 hypothetical protein [Prescottella agglutinans]